jgi:PAS domain S-box-containing protein
VSPADRLSEMSTFTTTALRSPEFVLRALMESARDGIMLKDLEGRILLANEAAGRMFGVTAAELIGRDLTWRFQPGHAASVSETDRLVIETGEQHTYESKGRTNDPSRTFLVTKTPWRDEDGRLIGLVTISRDITERKRAENALRESEARWRAVCDGSPFGVFITDTAGHCLYINARYQQLTSLTAKEAMGDGWSAALHPEDRERVFASWYASAKSHRPFQSVHRYLRKDGTIVWVRIHATEVHDGDTFQGYIGSVEDITQRRMAEEAMQARHRELEILLTVASHDLREPLRTMSSLASIVRDEYAPKLDEEGRDLLERIVRGTERMDELIEGVTMLVRAQRLAVSNRMVDGGACVADALRRLEPAIARQRASVGVNGPFPIVRAEKSWVVEVLYHLIANALKFTVDDAPPVVEVLPYETSPDHPAEAGFIVRDRGPGVPLDSREKIFHLFRRAVGRQIPGTGVGLAIVREVAERHRGRAFVRARQGGGSEFVVTFGATPKGSDS